MDFLKPFIDNFWKKFYIGILLLGIIISLKFINIEKYYSFIPLVICFLLTIIIFFFYKDSKFDLSSAKWFEKIKYELETTSNVLIYLKDFSHPDEATEKHRNDILAIMTEFARLICEYRENIKIMAYRPKNSKNNLHPEIWLKNKIQELDNSLSSIEAQELIDKSVSIINNQPNSNKYSFYLFDNDKLLYSKKSDSNKYQYFSIELGNSIIPHFLTKGFNNLNSN